MQSQNESRQTEQDVRVEKRKQLIERGVNPYPYRFPRTHLIKEVHQNAEAFVRDGEKVSVCGKIYAERSHGGSLFLDIADTSGKIQLYIKSDMVSQEKLDFIKNFLDIGDFFGAHGVVFRTKKGELSILVSDFELLAKALQPLPSEWYGVKDTETRYRKRYLDLLINEGVKERFKKRARIIDVIRDYLRKDNFLEIDTPVLQPIYGGANARPFTTRYESLKRDFYLRISNELYLKRALIGNLEKVFEFARDFRNEGIDATHNPEFTMVEIYEAYKDYEDFRTLTKDLVLAANKATGNTELISWGEKIIDISGEWPTISMGELLIQHTDQDILNASENELRDYAQQVGLDGLNNAPWGVLVDKIFSEKVEPHLIKPMFVIDYPLDISPLAKNHRKNGKLVERFELYIGGKEIANGFSELNDPIEQRIRFEAQQKNRKGGDDEAHPLDEDFLNAQEYGMPPAAGVGIGIDRLVMLLTNAQNIREVIMFPQLKTIDDF